MNKIPSYTKILTLGSSRTENALVGEVIIQEKIDGSQFKFGISESGELLFASKGCQLHPIQDELGEITNIQKLFLPAVTYLLSIKNKILTIFPPNTYFYAETLYKPKHNVLKYAEVPKNHIVLFDVCQKGKWITNRIELENIATMLEVDTIPELYRGEITIDQLKELLVINSYLGEEKIEGIVVKNYTQNILLGGFIFPLFTKYVREEFKERHGVEWKARKPKETILDYMKGFQNENRWFKALLHLKEKGLIENSPRDIGKLIKEVIRDVEEEEIENIKNYLYKQYIREIKRYSTKGLPEWYKEKLLENLTESE